MRTAQPHLRVPISLTVAAMALVSGGCGMSGITFGDSGGINTGGLGGICAGSNPAVTSIRVQPSQVNLRLGFDVRIEALPLDAQGQVAFCAPPVEWSSANASVATVSAGLVVGISAGKTYVRASSGGKVDSVAVNVMATTIGSVAMVSVPASLLVGQTVALGVVARDTDGNVITPRSIKWLTDDATVATISISGMLVTREGGTATVTVEAEGLTAVARIPVTRDAPTRRFRQIATGLQHTCAIVGGGGIPDGTAFCWGDGTVGQLGVGGTGIANGPLQVSGGHTFTSIAVGERRERLRDPPREIEEHEVARLLGDAPGETPESAHHAVGDTGMAVHGVEQRGAIDRDQHRLLERGRRRRAPFAIDGRQLPEGIGRAQRGEHHLAPVAR